MDNGQRDAALRRVRSVGDVPSSPPAESILAARRESLDANPTMASPAILGPSISLPSSPSNLTTFRPGSPPPAILEEALNEGNAIPEAADSPRPSIVITPAAETSIAYDFPQNITFVDYVPPRPAPPRQHNRSVYSRTMAFFGVGRGASRSRRALVALIWNLGWGFIQSVALITLLVLSSQLESKTMPGITEWNACGRPLGAWASLWSVRIVASCVLTYWGYERDKAALGNHSHHNNDPETTTIRNLSAQPTPPIASPISPYLHTPEPGRRATPNNVSTSSTSPDHPPLPYTLHYRRLSLFSSLFSLSWFLTAHILEYTTVNTCRFSSPHLWWLVFGLLCITYLMVLEVIFLGLVVFVMAPIIFLFWNILLMCLGRHPIQQAAIIKPEIGKLPKSVVEQIPLVMYIPPPPNFVSDGAPVKVSEQAHHYPPKPSPAPPAPPKRRFKFLKLKRKKKVESESASSSNKEGKKAAQSDSEAWEDRWEQDGYPFVVLEGNRAACAICLMDFEEPKKISDRESEKTEPPNEGSSKQHEEEIQVEPIVKEEHDDNVHLQDAGEGPQPLRLLACGHVFHRTCLDPWLTDVSGRCPVCQRPVDIPEPEKKKKFKRQNSGQ